MTRPSTADHLPPGMFTKIATRPRHEQASSAQNSVRAQRREVAARGVAVGAEPGDEDGGCAAGLQSADGSDCGVLVEDRAEADAEEQAVPKRSAIASCSERRTTKFSATSRTSAPIMQQDAGPAGEVAADVRAEGEEPDGERHQAHDLSEDGARLRDGPCAGDLALVGQPGICRHRCSGPLVGSFPPWSIGRWASGVQSTVCNHCSMTIELIEHTDPGCPWAYSASPALRRARLALRRPARLATCNDRADREPSEQYVKRGYTTARPKRSAALPERFGMPFAPQVEGPAGGDRPGCRAIHAAAPQDPAASGRRSGRCSSRNSPRISSRPRRLAARRSPASPGSTARRSWRRSTPRGERGVRGRPRRGPHRRGRPTHFQGKTATPTGRCATPRRRWSSARRDAARGGRVPAARGLRRRGREPSIRRSSAGPCPRTRSRRSPRSSTR